MVRPAGGHWTEHAMTVGLSLGSALDYAPLKTRSKLLILRNRINRVFIAIGGRRPAMGTPLRSRLCNGYGEAVPAFEDIG